jgi:hypothetical protein
LPGAIHQVENPNLIKLYPNPVNSFLAIDLEKNYKKVQIEISDVLGKVLILRQCNDEKIIRINDLKLSAGIYNVKVTMNNLSPVKRRIVVQ